MASLSNRPVFAHEKISQTSTDAVHLRQWEVPLGRLLFSLIFIMSGLNHFTSGSIGYAQSQGIPMPAVLVPLTGLMIMLGGLSILLGFKARFGALLIALFLIPVTFTMHAFWNVADPTMAQNQMAHFLKNIGLLGGAILVIFYGAGPVSIDHRGADRKE